ncbi:hypothetical protein ACGF07_25530 [Kitasatospora sp. NPDC048194]|uniref:hypothetical protein n=1 Tax=Kitasatospora sp. NPDC048194 TaxID=3364045 RepID=UPI003718E80E
MTEDYRAQPNTKALTLVDVTTTSDAEPSYILGHGTYEALVAMGWTPPATTEGD